MGLQLDGVWSSLREDPGVGVILVNRGGELLYVNDQALWLYTGDTQTDWRGKNVRDFYAEGPTEERLRIIERCLDEDRPIVLRHVRRGKQLQATFWPLDEEEDGTPVDTVLVITREGVSKVPEGEQFDVQESDFADWGPLEVLTRRELEVLALIGHGLSLEETAKRLHRSRKTIDKHRVSIGKKLGATNRVQLSKIADAAGLEVGDANLQRYPTPSEGEGRGPKER